MQLRYDDDFVESAVFTVANGRRARVPSLQIRRFHGERERCYAVAHPDERNAAFFKLHLAWFREWGLEALLLGLLKEHPLIPPALNALAFRKVRSKKDEAAELYVSAENGRSAVIAMRPERFERDSDVACLLRHELAHLSDMVDPAFGYSPDVRLQGAVPTPQRLVRERYRLLWDITIDGRLSRAKHAIQTPRERHEELFESAYSFWSEAKRREVFQELWTSVAPRHARLIELASDPRDLARGQGPLPGGSCSLCGFPTFEWSDASSLSEETMLALSEQFPNWTPMQGACKRCVEIYEVAGRFEAPSTVVL